MKIPAVVFSVLSVVTVSRGDIIMSPGCVDVVVGPKCSKVARFAAADLTNHLSKVLGCEVPVVSALNDKRVQIVVGDSQWTRDAGVDVDGLPRDAFRIKCSGNRVYLAGRDHPSDDLGASLAKGVYPRREHATAFAVCEFLERYAGVRFYFPDEYGTVVPKAKSIRVPAVDEVVKPQFTIRNCYIGNGGTMPDVKDEAEDKAKRAMYQLRLRENTLLIPCCHGQNKFRIAQRFASTHPEYFQLRENGTRATELDVKPRYMVGQLCHTSPVWDIFRKETIERMRANHKYVDLMPQDSMKACRCTSCMSRYNQTNSFDLASGFCSDLIWSNTVAVANAVRAEGLDAYVTQMAYGPSRLIPDFEIPDNVKVVLAVGGPWACSRRDVFDCQVDFVRRWSEKIGERVAWVWMYPMKNYDKLQASRVPQHAPRAYYEYHKRVAPYMDGSYLESNQGEDTLFYQYLNYYVFSRFAWDHAVDVEKILSEHHRLMFGAGAKHVGRFFDRLEELWIGKVAVPSLIPETEMGPAIYPPSELEIYRDIYNNAVMRELAGYLDAAARSVPSGSLESKRIATLRSRFLTPLAVRRNEFIDAVSVRVEQERRKVSAEADILDGLEWQVDPAAGSVIDRKICVEKIGSVRIDADGKSVSARLDLKSVADRLVPGAKYLLSCFVKADGVEVVPDPRGRRGAWIEFEQGGKGLKYSAYRFNDKRMWCGTYDWMHQSFVVEISPDAARKGYAPNLWLRTRYVQGRIWFDGIRLERIR